MTPARGEPEPPPPGPARDLVDLFRRLRAAKPMSNAQLAIRTGRSRGHVSDVLNGRAAPSPELAAAIAEALGQNAATTGHARELAEALAELNRFQHRQRRAEAPASTTSAGVWQRPVSGMPRTDECFIGQEEGLYRLEQALTGGGVVVLHGMPGVGKTALAVQAALRAGSVFPDGMLFLDLHGYTAGQSPLDPATAMGRVLHRFGQREIPEAAEERSAVLRDLLTDRRVLVVLDDAHDAAQVEPLLPRSRGCAVLVTSRQRLAALDDALSMALGVMQDDDAAALFRRVAGSTAATEADASALAEVIERCGHLPLAVRIAAARHRTRAGRPLAELASRLSLSYEILAELDDGERSVAAAFEVSFSDLPDVLRHTFLLLAIHPGTELTDGPVAALLRTTNADAGRRLDQLAGRSLLIEVDGGRYRFHDLVAGYARQKAADLPQQERETALQSLIEYNLLATGQASRWIAPHRQSTAVDIRTKQTGLPALQSYSDATAWLAAEQANLIDICLAAGTAGFDVACWQLANLLRDQFFLTKDWRSWLLTHAEGLAAAQRARDRAAEALMQNNMGLAEIEQGHSDAARDHYLQARRLYTLVGHEQGRNTAEANLAWLAFNRGDYLEFVTRTRPVLESYRHAGHERNAAITLRGLGLAYGKMGQTGEAVAALREALQEFERLALPLDLAMTLNGLGESYLPGSDLAAASDAFRRALAAARQCGSAFEQARALQGLGVVALATHNSVDARDNWEQALVLFHGLGSPQAQEVEDRIRSLQSEEADS